MQFLKHLSFVLNKTWLKKECLFFFSYFDVCLFVRVPAWHLQVPKAGFLDVFLLGYGELFWSGVVFRVGGKVEGVY